MRHATIVGIFTVMLTLVPGLVFAENVIAADQKSDSYKFVMRATSGNLKGDILTLNGVPNVVYFSDRTPKEERIMSVSKFIDLWNIQIDKNKAYTTNATLSVLNKNGNSRDQWQDWHSSFVIDGKCTDGNSIDSGTVVFNVRVLENGVKSNTLKRLAKALNNGAAPGIIEIAGDLVIGQFDVNPT